MTKNVSIIFKSMLLCLAYYSVLRLIFYIYSFSYFGSLSVGEVLLGFLHGLRFDWYCVAWASAPTILLWAFGLTQFIWVRRFTAFSFVLLNLVMVFPIHVNIEYFQFSNRHLSRDIFAMKNDIGDQWWNLLIYYPFLLTLLFFSAFFLFKVRPRLSAEEVGHFRVPKLKFSLIQRILVLTLAVISARGGTQGKPLRPSHAYLTPKAEVAILSLNSTLYSVSH